jgi:hypothetical protein
MNARAQFLGERFVDKALPLDSTFAGKGGSDDCHGEMRLALGPRASMAGMSMRLVHDVEPQRSEPLDELPADRVGYDHGGEAAGRDEDCQGAVPARKPARSSTI